MSTSALSGHGATIKRNGTIIGEMGDVTLPGLIRNEFEALTQGENIDSYILGVLRREPVQFSINFIPSAATHDHLTGLIAAINTEPVPYDRWDFTTPGGFSMIASGQVKAVHNIKSPVDGKLSADVEVRLSGKFIINGVSFG